MEESEYETLALVEQTHWWFVGFRDLVRRCLRLERFQLPANPTVLDAGCGTGGNLAFLARELAPRYLGGFDLAEQAVDRARRNCPTADIYLSDIRDPELRKDRYDLVVSCDVIYVPGLDAARDGLARICERLAANGLFIVNLPAYQWLYSDHDRAVHTKERYVKSQIARLFNEMDLKCELLSYRLCSLFPLLVASRLPSILGIRTGTDRRSELELPARPINALLSRILKMENFMIAGGASLPFGSSIIAIGRKK